MFYQNAMKFLCLKQKYFIVYEKFSFFVRTNELICEFTKSFHSLHLRFCGRLKTRRFAGLFFV